MERVQKRNVDRDVPVGKKLDDLYELIDGMDVCLMTTRRSDGQLVTRPMAVQQRTDGADLWFVTNIETHKLDELANDPHVNLGFYRDRTREWVSVSGTARVSRDREKIRELHSPTWRMWFPDDGRGHNGEPDDPRIALVFVDADTVVYSKRDRPAPAVLWEMARAMATGDAPKVADVRHVDAGELPQGGAPPA